MSVKLNMDQFYEKYGALSRQETNRAAEVCERTTTNLGIIQALGLSEKIEEIRGDWISFVEKPGSLLKYDSYSSVEEQIRSKAKFVSLDSEGKATIEEHPLHGLSFFQSLKLKYSHFRGEVQENYVKAYHKICKEHASNIAEFQERMKTSPTPLQDLRDFGTRVQTMDLERINLRVGWEAYICARGALLKGLSRFEKFVFKIAAYVHDIFCSRKGPYIGINNAVKPLQFQEFQREAKIGETEYKGQRYDVTAELKADQKGRKFNGVIELKIKRNGPETKGQVEASMTFQRVWGKKMMDKPTEYSVVHDGIPPTIPVDTHRMYFDHLLVSNPHNYKAFSMLFSQIAVEMFLREPDEDHLSIDTEHQVLVMGGFTSHHMGRNDSPIVKAIETARTQNLQFPCIESDPTAELSVYKMPQSHSNAQTVLASGNWEESGRVWYAKKGWANLVFGPAYVEYEIGQKETWEERIKRMPILAGEAPVLPKYILKQNITA